MSLTASHIDLTATNALARLESLHWAVWDIRNFGMSVLRFLYQVHRAQGRLTDYTFNSTLPLCLFSVVTQNIAGKYANAVLEIVLHKLVEGLFIFLAIDCKLASSEPPRKGRIPSLTVYTDVLFIRMLALYSHGKPYCSFFRPVSSERANYST